VTVSVAEANATLTAPGQLFEMEELDIRGVATRTWKNAPPSLRAVLDLSLAHGDATFLVYEDERTSFVEHYRIACTLAHRLQDEFGVAQGDRVAIAMRNLPEWVMAFWAITLTGAIVVPLNAWWSGEELRYGLEDSASKVAFVDTQRADTIRPVSRPAGRRRWPNGPSPWRWVRSMGTPRPLTSPLIRRTTPPSSIPPARPDGPRAPWARTATSAPT
jgi:non-ribosomal peptide synthetase component F